MCQVFGSASAIAGGWTSSGGGSGVACYDSVAAKNKAEILIDQAILNARPIPIGAVQGIKLVQVLDFYEASTSVQKEIQDLQGLPDEQSNAADLMNTANLSAAKKIAWQSIHQKILENVALLSPAFFELIQGLHGKLAKLHWTKNFSLPLLLDQKAPSKANIDTSSEVPLAANCKRIQIAIWRSKSEITQHSGYFAIPEQNLDFDLLYNPLWWNLLNPLNQAILVLHEELFLLGQAIGHTHSSDIRYWARELALLTPGKIHKPNKEKFSIPTREEFALQFPTTMTKENKFGIHYPKHPSRMRRLLIDSFGDYLLYFFESEKVKSKDELKPGVKPDLTGSEQTLISQALDRYLAYSEFLLQVRQQVSDCSDSGLSKSKCLEVVLSPINLIQSLTDLQTFAHLSAKVLDKNLELLNSDYLFLRSNDPKLIKESHQATRASCDLLAQLQAGTVEAKLISKALRYCSEVQGNKSK